MKIRIDHHFHDEHHECPCTAELRELRHAVAGLHADFMTWMTREEVPQEVADEIGRLCDNIDNNFREE